MVSILERLEHPALALELRILWDEYEDGETHEAVLARQLDRFEMIVQADEYEKQQGVDLTEFFTSTAHFFTHTEVLSWADLLRENRRVRLSSK